MSALIEIAALCLLPCLFRLLRNRDYIRIRIKPRRSASLPVLIGVAVLIITLATRP